MALYIRVTSTSYILSQLSSRLPACRHRVVVLQLGLEVQSSRLPVRHSSLTLIHVHANSQTLLLQSFLRTGVLALEGSDDV